MKKPITIIFSCEHAVNTIPDSYAHYFTHYQELLDTHRGIDFGAGEIADALSQALDCTLFKATLSRLLIDYNRSLTQADCFSEISVNFLTNEKNQLIEDYYLPYRQQIELAIHSLIEKGYQVWHLSIHSFTPILNDLVRKGDIGLLYDPKRLAEKKLAQRWQRLLKRDKRPWHTRMNYPYKGTADGLTTSLRKHFSDNDYIGLEVESNQALTKDPLSRASLITALISTLKRLYKGSPN